METIQKILLFILEHAELFAILVLCIPVGILIWCHIQNLKHLETQHKAIISLTSAVVAQQSMLDKQVRMWETQEKINSATFGTMSLLRTAVDIVNDKVSFTSVRPPDWSAYDSPESHGVE